MVGLLVQRPETAVVAVVVLVAWSARMLLQAQVQAQVQTVALVLL